MEASSSRTGACGRPSASTCPTSTSRAGGWHNLPAMRTSYQQGDAANTRRVVDHGTHDGAPTALVATSEKRDIIGSRHSSGHGNPRVVVRQRPPAG
jgi:hypothetical protein